MVTCSFSLGHMEQKLITDLSWIWELIIYQTKDTFQEFRTKGIALGKWSEELPAAGRSYSTPEVKGGGREDQSHIQGVMAAWAQEGLEEPSHVEG